MLRPSLRFSFKCSFRDISTTCATLHASDLLLEASHLTAGREGYECNVVLCIKKIYERSTLLASLQHTWTFKSICVDLSKVSIFYAINGYNLYLLVKFRAKTFPFFPTRNEARIFLNTGNKKKSHCWMFGYRTIFFPSICVHLTLMSHLVNSLPGRQHVMLNSDGGF